MANHIYERLSALSFSRPSGLPEERKAAEWVKAEIRNIGFIPVTEPFSYIRNVAEEAALLVSGKNGEWISFPVTGMTDSAATGTEEENAPFYDIKTFDEVTLERAKNCFVMVHDRLSPENYQRLKEGGIRGYVMTSGTIRDTYENSDLETARFRDNLLEYASVPAFSIRTIDAVKLLREHPTQARFCLRTRRETVHSENILVEIRGTRFSEEVVVGAHYDSVPFSLGSWDNGAGVVQLLSLLEHLQTNPPKRTVRVIFFGSEETGLRGSRAYTEEHRDQLEKVRMMLNVDVGGSLLGGEMLFVTAEEETEVWLRHLLREIGYAAEIRSGVMSSDCASFNDQGIPSIGIGQMAPRGGGYMHTRYDNMDLMDADVLSREAEFLARLTDRLVNAEVFPIPKKIPEKLQKEVISYFGASKSALAKQKGPKDAAPQD